MATSIEHIEHLRHVSSADADIISRSEAAGRVRIAYSTDMDGFEPALVSMMSALESTRRPVTVHFMGCNLTDEALHRLEVAVRRHPQAELHLYNAHPEFFGGRSVSNYPRVVMAILHIPKLLAGRVVYLDVDTLVHGDIGALFDADLDGHCIGAVRDYGTLAAIAKRLPEDRGEWVVFEKELMHPHPHTDFFNSGVVLFDNDAIRSTPGLKESMTDEMGLGGDQNVLNYHMKGRVFHLGPSWNAYAGIFNTYTRMGYAATGAVLAPATPARIAHFVGSVKPWHDFDPDELMVDIAAARKRVFRQAGLDSPDHVWKLPDSVCVAEYVAAVKCWRRAHARLMSALDNA